MGSEGKEGGCWRREREGVDRSKERIRTFKLFEEVGVPISLVEWDVVVGCRHGGLDDVLVAVREISIVRRGLGKTR